MTNDDDAVGDDELHAYVDDFLDPVARARVERYLSAHPEAAARVAAWRSDTRNLRRILAPEANEPVPEALALRHLVSSRGRSRQHSWGLAAGIAAAFLAGTGAGWFGRGSDERHGLASLTHQAAVAQQVFSSAPQTSGGTVQPAALPLGAGSDTAGPTIHPPDLSAAGYALAGWRLVPTEQGSAAFFIYRNQADERIGVMVRLMIGVDTDAPLRAEPALNATGYAWSRHGIGISLVSSSRGGDLRGIAERLRDQMIGGS